MISIRFVLVMTLLGLLSTTSLYSQRDSIIKYDFVFLDTLLDHADYDIRYAGDNNFLGRPVTGYYQPRLILSRQAAMALKDVEDDIYESGYTLLLYDTYRPQRAVDNFRSWARTPEDTVTRSQYYPEHDKRNLFKLGYISTRSGHSRGSTIDLTMRHVHTGQAGDMGGPYDYFGELSHHNYNQLTAQQKQHRIILKSAMQRHGFRPYSKEWWHYTLNGEPYRNQYFDFIVE